MVNKAVVKFSDPYVAFVGISHVLIHFHAFIQTLLPISESNFIKFSPKT